MTLNSLDYRLKVFKHPYDRFQYLLYIHSKDRLKNVYYYGTILGTNLTIYADKPIVKYFNRDIGINTHKEKEIRIDYKEELEVLRNIAIHVSSKGPFFQKVMSLYTFI